ncbi:MAG: metal-dependent transcriptional regulator [Verrucomicrobia bacterium]|nr:metal-dependent transcriptional regulator [Verrucomicrobiota bacterium]
MSLASPILAALAVAWLVWPRRGLIARCRHALLLSDRLRREDALKHVLKLEANRQVATVESVAGALHIRSDQAATLLEDMEQGGLLSYSEGRLLLRPAGRELAVHVIRAHRLWESYLAEQTGVAESEWHQRAERQEHFLSRQETRALSARLGYPQQDPHGDSIPDERGELDGDCGQPLNAAPLNTPLVLTHIEDEPELIYAQIAAEGLSAGMKAVVIEKTPKRIRFRADGAEHVLAPILANNISVALLPETSTQELFAEEYLASLRPGQSARVLGLARGCRGAERRRLLDLGFVPGTIIEMEMVSPGGDPTAYRVRGALIALRREQSRLIRISRATPLAA